MVQDPRSESPAARHARLYWRKTRLLTAALLAVWVLVSFVLTFHARSLTFSFFGWPFSFWVASQGALLVYLLILVVYAMVMRRFDAHYAADAEQDIR